MALTPDAAGAVVHIPGRRRMLAAGAVLVVLFASLVAMVLRGEDDPPPQPQVVYGANPTSVGGTYSMGFMVLNEDALDVEVLDVRANVSENLDVIGVRVVAPLPGPPYTPYSGGPGFPPHPPDWDVDFRELPARISGSEFATAVTNQRHVEVVVGFRVTRGDPDVAAVNGVTVTYRIGDDRRTEDFPHAMIICVLPNADCHAEDTDLQLQRLGLLARP